MKLFFTTITFFALLITSTATFADDTEWTTGKIRLKHEYQHFFLPNASNYIYEEIDNAQNNQDKKMNEFCSDIKKPETKTDEVNTSKIIKKVNTEKIKAYLAQNIAHRIDLETLNVSISKDESGKILFDGYAQPGKKLNIDISAELIAMAIQNNINIVTLDVSSIDPLVEVKDEELKKQGIKEVVSIGRSDFYPSSRKRIQNVMAGASKFNGFIVKKGSVFSFNDNLGLVDGSTGYAKEYVILGPKVEKEYGGGLCQVSSTAYRGVMLGGMEVVERYNHSFAVNHYLPYGSDATIYQGVKDFRWKNDSPSDILIQTRRGGERNSELFFIYYGTKPQRDVKVFGPSFKNYKSPPKNKKTYSTELPAGTQKTVSNRVQGFDATFGRQVLEKGKEKFNDTFFSPYQARGNWVIYGGTDPSISSTEVARTETEEE